MQPKKIIGVPQGGQPDPPLLFSLNNSNTLIQCLLNGFLTVNILNILKITNYVNNYYFFAYISYIIVAYLKLIGIRTHAHTFMKKFAYIIIILLIII